MHILQCDYLFISTVPLRRNSNTEHEGRYYEYSHSQTATCNYSQSEEDEERQETHDVLFFFRNFMCSRSINYFQGFKVSVSASCSLTVLGPASQPWGDGPTLESQGASGTLREQQAGLQEAPVASLPTTPGPCAAPPSFTL